VTLVPDVPAGRARPGPRPPRSGTNRDAIVQLERAAGPGPGECGGALHVVPRLPEGGTDGRRHARARRVPSARKARTPSREGGLSQPCAKASSRGSWPP
jgi:hypothetical protein